MKVCILLASFTLPLTSAWCANQNESRRPSKLMSEKDPSNESRRDFFQSAAVKAATLPALVGASSLLLSAAPVVADDSTTSYSKVYEPESHSMDNKIVLITGGNTGLGLESVKRLAAAGATVVFTSRESTKGQRALDEVNQYLAEKSDSSFVGKAMFTNLDLCDLENVKSFNKRLASKIGEAKVDVLLNNAGVMAIPDRRLTKDGFEQTFQTNYLGHFALTSTILPQLSPDAKIINVSSAGYLFAKNGLEMDNLNGEREYGPWSSYGLSKLENILFTNEIRRRAQNSEKWSNLRAYSLHPGAVQTDLARYLIGEEKFQSMKENGFSNWKDKVLMESLAKFVKTVQEGASTQVYLASSAIAENRNGNYFTDGKVSSLQAPAMDQTKGEELWDVSEKLAGVTLKF